MEAQTKKIQETANGELGDLKSKQNWTITAMKNAAEGITGANEAAGWTRERESLLWSRTEKWSEDSLRALWDNITRTSVHIIGVPEGEEREKEPEKILKTDNS